MSAEQLKRLFPFSDPVAIQLARVFVALITRDLSFFTAYDLDFNAAFITNFESLISAAAAMPDHEFMQDQLAILTTEVNSKMEAGRKVFRLLRPFVEKTFPGRKDIWNLFGADDYHGIRNSQVGLTAFLAKVHQAAVKYRTELNAAGYTDVNITKLNTSHDDIVKANVEQDDFKIQMKEQTNERIRKMNAMWEVVLRINQVGKTIFEDDYGKYQQYIIYHSSTPGEPDILNGIVPAGQTVVVLQENITPSTVFKLKNPGTTGLEYCLGETPEPCTGGIELNPGEEHETTASEMGTGSILKVTNKSADTEGNYEVEVS